MGNGYGYASIQQGAVKRLWDVKQEETEVMWLLAEKLKAKGFPNLFDYYSKEFKDPETGKAPTTALEFSEIAAKMTSAPLWNAQGAAEGRRADRGLGRLPQEGHVQRREVHAEEGLGRQVRHRDQEVRVLQRDREEGPARSTRRSTRPRSTTSSTVSGYVARGELAFVPHYEPPKRHGSLDEYPFTFVDYKSRLNREGRSANLPWYQEFKKVDPGDVSWDDVLKMNPADGAKLGLKTGDTVKITSPAGRDGHQAQAVGGRAPGHRREVLRPGPLGLRPRRREGLRQGACRAAATTTTSWSTTTTA